MSRPAVAWLASAEKALYRNFERRILAGMAHVERAFIDGLISLRQQRLGLTLHILETALQFSEIDIVDEFSDGQTLFKCNGSRKQSE